MHRERLCGDVDAFVRGKSLGQSIYIENHTGAAGTLGTQMVAAAANDGYTITVGGMTTHVLAPAIYPKLAYDSIKDFTTIGRIGTSSIMLVATRDFPANDLLGGHISLATLDMATATPLVKDGSIKALAACGERSPSLPDVLSYKAQGVPFDRSLSWAVYTPAGLAEPIAKKLSAALKDALGDAEMKEKLLGLGITPQFVSGDEQRDINARDIAAWKQVAKDAGIELK
ncbi:tripartite tricarboxylate transporter substrate binding protein [Bradyrhizobium sp. 139]|uniref:Bug family tripartite tricarboxylate transporter substrate binding protein n=1 Tax=Bradyrhizobium sp. 139 TaxID=2782616 RepID=UPI0031FEFBFE